MTSPVRQYQVRSPLSFNGAQTKRSFWLIRFSGHQRVAILSGTRLQSIVDPHSRHSHSGAPTKRARIEGYAAVIDVTLRPVSPAS